MMESRDILNYRNKHPKAWAACRIVYPFGALYPIWEMLVYDTPNFKVGVQDVLIEVILSDFSHES